MEVSITMTNSETFSLLWFPGVRSAAYSRKGKARRYKNYNQSCPDLQSVLPEILQTSAEIPDNHIVPGSLFSAGPENLRPALLTLWKRSPDLSRSHRWYLPIFAHQGIGFPVGLLVCPVFMVVHVELFSSCASSFSFRNSSFRIL